MVPPLSWQSRAATMERWKHTTRGRYNRANTSTKGNLANYIIRKELSAFSVSPLHNHRLPDCRVFHMIVSATSHRHRHSFHPIPRTFTLYDNLATRRAWTPIRGIIAWELPPPVQFIFGLVSIPPRGRRPAGGNSERGIRIKGTKEGEAVQTKFHCFFPWLAFFSQRKLFLSRRREHIFGHIQ